MNTFTRITFELIDPKDFTVVHKKVYEPHTEEKMINVLTEIAHIHSFTAKLELFRRLEK